MDKITSTKVSAYKVPTDITESDGTLEWNSTTLVLVEIDSGNETGIGYTYAHQSTAVLIQDILFPIICNKNPFQIEKLYTEMVHAIRNNGNAGIAFMALSAVDVALWDLKAKVLNLPLITLLGKAREDFPVYGSGGFTSYTYEQLQHQLGTWASSGFKEVKMKIGREPEKDFERVKIAKQAIGETNLFVDANGAYSVQKALKQAEAFQEFGVIWFEEPVSSDNHEGLKYIREKAPSGMQIAAGEYGYQLPYFTHMLKAKTVDVMQADLTRCGGITGFRKVAHLCDAFNTPFSSHCAPALHLHPVMSLSNFYTGEYFHDHVRIESLFFEGVPAPENGKLKPDLTRNGLGLELKIANAEKYKIL